MEKDNEIIITNESSFASYFSAILTLLFALAISGVAAYYSVSGLMAIFSGAAFAVAIMGGALEAGKLIAASWLYNNWKTSPTFLKAYLSVAVVVLMFITSMGIFGFLSKAHVENVNPSTNNQAKIEKIEFDIQRQQKRTADSEHVLEQFDAVLSKYLEKGYVTRGLKEREKQTSERITLQQDIKAANEEINALSEQKFVLEKEVRSVEVEVGPLKYVAELIYGSSSDHAILDKAVRLVILILIFVFDPLAVLLVIAGNISLAAARKHKTLKKLNSPPVDDDILVEIVDEPRENLTKTEYEYIPVIVESENLQPSPPETIVVHVPPEPINIDVSKTVSDVFSTARTPFNLSGPDGEQLKHQLVSAVNQEIRDSQTPKTQ